MDYDFIEIGTSDFATLAGRATENTVGISVEPLKAYLDRLPNNKYVTKVCAAVVTEERYKISNSCKIFYIDEKNIEKDDYWLKGCNSIDLPHPDHPNGKLIESVEVVCITFSMLVDTYNIDRINLLKVDIEGGDCPLVIDIINYYKNNNLIEKLPKKIYFETNHLSTKEQINSALLSLSEVGYEITRIGLNTLASLKCYKISQKY
jgi:FkbM family methyltransferase